MPGFRYQFGSGQDAGQSRILDWTDPIPIPVTTISANVRPTPHSPPSSLPKQHQNCGVILTPGSRISQRHPDPHPHADV